MLEQRLGHLHQAYDNLKLALDLIEHADDDLEEARMLNTFAAICHRLDRLTEALAHHQHALTIFRREGATATRPLRSTISTGRGRRHSGWACYHTEMWTVDLDSVQVGVVGMAVGAPFAVLVAEQLAESGAELLISITSAGQIGDLPATPCFVLIDRALRDEGTSLHYLPPARWSRLDTTLHDKLTGAFGHLPEPVVTGDSWTTDAPYRETAAAIDAAREAGAGCVEMEAAALYAYALARGRRVVCLAHVTNTMATAGDDFEKGADNGVHSALAVTRAVAVALG